MAAPQFYETTVLFTVPGRGEPYTKWLELLTSPPEIPYPEELAWTQETLLEAVPERVPTTKLYEQLISEASESFEVPPGDLNFALWALIDASDLPRKAGIARVLDQMSFARTYEPPRPEDGPPPPPYRPPELRVALQAMSLDIVPLETSPLTKTSLAKAAAGSSTMAICFYTGGPVLMIIGSFGLVAVQAVGSALWKGAEPEVKDFGADVTAAFLDAIRRKLGISRRKR
jgi:hypothetical protein